MIHSSKSKLSHINRTDIKMSISIQYFISGIESEATKKQYLFLIEQFRTYFKIKDYDSLLTIHTDEMKKLI